MTEGELPLSNDWGDWVFETNAQFSGRADRRGLYAVIHPWTESHSGDEATLSRNVAVPEGWSGPLVLCFTATDNHHGVGYRAEDWPHYLGADIFWGHRFAQLLLDDELLWEQDVAQSDSPFWRDSATREAYCGYTHSVQLLRHLEPGSNHRLSLRILDKVGSGTPLPGDVHQPHYWEPSDIDRTQTNRWFDFMAWWGDVTLSRSKQEHAAARTFAERIVLKGPSARTQVVARQAERVELTIARHDTLPTVPYPLWGGIPFPRGLVSSGDEIRLRTAVGEEAPCQVKVCSRWPADGSVQWAWIHTVATAGQQTITLECGGGVVRSEPAASVVVVEQDGAILIDTGAAIARIGRPGGTALLDSVALHDGPSHGPVVGILNQQMLGWLRHHVTHCEEVAIEETGPVRAAVRIQGQMADEQGNRFGRFTCRVWAWVGCPLVSLSFRIFQDTDQRVAVVDDLLLEVGTSLQDALRGGFSAGTVERPLPEGQVREWELRQPDASHYTIYGKRFDVIEEGEHAPGWANLVGTSGGQSGGIAAAVRWFWQQVPKTLTVSDQGLILGLFQRRKRDDWDLDSPLYMMTRGEAKRHQVWLLPHDGTVDTPLLSAVQAAWDARPHLFDAKWFARSGVLGNLAPHGPAHFAEMGRYLRTWDETELGDVRYGIRDFRETKWCQNYRGRAANGLMEYWLSGRPEWQEYFEQVMAHHVDVDTIHYEPDRPQWVGAIRSYSPYHTTGDASHGINSNCQDQFLHYFFAGEPDSWAQATAAADHIAALSGDQGRSARQEGWPLAQMSIAYLWTGEERYLQAAQRFLEYARLYTHPRRGAYDEIHSSFSHRGIVPFMTGYLGYGLVRYHEATDDPGAAQLLVALTEATIAETSDGNGGFWYSPCPTQRMWGSTGWTLLIGGMAAYAYRVTGDVWFEEQARICYRRVVDSGGPSLDMAPLLGELLAGLGDPE